MRAPRLAKEERIGFSVRRSRSRDHRVAVRCARACQPAGARASGAALAVVEPDATACAARSANRQGPVTVPLHLHKQYLLDTVKLIAVLCTR